MHRNYSNAFLAPVMPAISMHCVNPTNNSIHMRKTFGSSTLAVQKSAQALKCASKYASFNALNNSRANTQVLLSTSQAENICVHVCLHSNNKQHA